MSTVSTHVVVLYCLFGLLLLLFAFVMFKVFILTTKVKTISTFLDGQVFSERFHHVISNYFSHSNNLDMLMDQILPLVYAHTTVAYTFPIVTDTGVEMIIPTTPKELQELQLASEDAPSLIDTVLV